MKKRLFSLLLVTALCAGLLTVPVEATDLPNTVIFGGSNRWFYGQDDYEFWYTYETRLFPSALTPGIPQTFHDGMKLLTNNTLSQYRYSLYLTEDGRVVDLNRNRFDYMGVFSEGLAPFFVSDERLDAFFDPENYYRDSPFEMGYGNYVYYGYVNTEGVVVIPPYFTAFDCGFHTKNDPERFPTSEYHSLALGGPAAGKFIGGKAMIPGYFDEWGAHDEDELVFDLSTFVPGADTFYSSSNYSWGTNSYSESWWERFYRQGGISDHNDILGYIFIDKTGQWTGEYGVFDSYDSWVAGISMYIYNAYGATPDIMFQDPLKIVPPDPEVPYVLWDGDPVDWSTVSEFDLGDYVPNVPQESTTPVPVIPEPTPQPTPEPEAEGQVTAEGIRVLAEKCDFDWDTSAAFDVTFTNTTDHPIQGSYCLVSYEPAIWRQIDKSTITGKLLREPTESVVQQFMFFDLDLAPGESLKKEKIGVLSPACMFASMLWVKFDSQEEKEAFIANSPLWQGSWNCYVIHGNETAKQFFLDNFGITFLPPVDHVTYYDIIE